MGAVLVALASFCLAASPPARTGKVVERVAATVNEEVVLLSEVKQHAAEMAAQMEMLAPGSAPKDRCKMLKDALDDLVAEKLFESEMRTLNVDVAEGEIDYALDDVKKQNKLDGEQFEGELRKQGYTLQSYREFLHKQLARMKLLQLKVRSKIRVSDEDVKAEYARRAKLDEADEEVRPRHLLLKVPKGATPKQEEAVVQRARELAKRARAGEDFTALIKKHSEGPSRDEGGDVGWFRRGAMVPEFERAAFGLKVGEVSEPVKTSFGYHVLKLEERRKLAPKPFEEVRDELREKLLREQMAQYTQGYVEELRRASEVDVKAKDLCEAGGEAPQAP